MKDFHVFPLPGPIGAEIVAGRWVSARAPARSPRRTFFHCSWYSPCAASSVSGGTIGRSSLLWASAYSLSNTLARSTGALLKGRDLVTMKHIAMAATKRRRGNPHWGRPLPSHILGKLHSRVIPTSRQWFASLLARTIHCGAPTCCINL
jgi:hypothetical protein